jgi:hypothetical protein
MFLHIHVIIPIKERVTGVANVAMTHHCTVDSVIGKGCSLTVEVLFPIFPVPPQIVVSHFQDFSGVFQFVQVPLASFLF